ncbi:hypothetical protein RCL1_005270 [Eukaryota sp. TZLM3-RCL]
MPPIFLPNAILRVVFTQSFNIVAKLSINKFKLCSWIIKRILKYSVISISFNKALIDALVHSQLHFKIDYDNFSHFIEKMPSQLHSLPIVTMSIPKAVYQFEFNLTPSYQHYVYIPNGTTIKNFFASSSVSGITKLLLHKFFQLTSHVNSVLPFIHSSIRHLEIFNSSVSLTFPMSMSALSVLRVYTETYYEELGISIDVSNLFALEEFHSNNYDQIDGLYNLSNLQILDLQGETMTIDSLHPGSSLLWLKIMTVSSNLDPLFSNIYPLSGCKIILSFAVIKLLPQILYPNVVQVHLFFEDQNSLSLVEFPNLCEIHLDFNPDIFNLSVSESNLLTTLSLDNSIFVPTVVPQFNLVDNHVLNLLHLKFYNLDLNSLIILLNKSPMIQELEIELRTPNPDSLIEAKFSFNYLKFLYLNECDYIYQNLPNVLPRLLYIHLISISSNESQLRAKCPVLVDIVVDRFYSDE